MKRKSYDILKIVIIIMVTTSIGTGILAFNEKSNLFATLLSGIGTLLLGVVSWGQNENVHEIEKKANVRADSCNIYIENNDYSADNYLSNEYSLFGYKESEEEHISLKFINYSEAFLKAIEISFGEYKFYSSITIAKGKDKVFNIYLPEDSNSYANQICKITFISCYNEKTYGDFKIICDEEDYQPRDIVHYHFYGTEQPI